MQTPVLVTIILSTSLVSAAAMAQGYAHCEHVYEAATHNIDMSEGAYESHNVVYDQYCSASGSIKQGSSEIGLETVVKSLPFKFTGRHDNAKTMMAQFCKTYSQVRYGSSANRVYSNKVVVDALKAFNQCVSLTKQGVIVTHSAPYGINSVFSFSLPSSLTYKLQGIQTDGAIKCVVNSPIDGTQVALAKGTSLEFRENFSAFCDREAQEKSDGGLTYPRTSVIFASNHGSYTAIFPEEETLPIQRAAQIEQRIANAENRLEALSTNLSTEASKQARTSAQIMDDLKRLKSNIAVTTSMFYIGPSPGDNPVKHFGCGTSPQDAAKNICGAQGGGKPIFHLVRDWGGGPCGHSYFTLTCLRN